MAMKSVALVGIAALVALGACSSGDGPSGTVDAAHGTHNDAPAPPNGTALDHVLFVNTEGVDLHPGSEDATLNVSSLVHDPATADPFADGEGDRATRIAAIVGEVQAVLAPYDIQVVTVRPATGPYHQIVLTDSHPADLGFSTPGLTSLSPYSCRPSASEIALVFGAEANATPHVTATNIVASFGIVSVIPLVATAGDCMCVAAASCGSLTEACTIGGPNTALDTTNDTCHGDGATIDEAAVWLSTFGAYR